MMILKNKFPYLLVAVVIFFLLPSGKFETVDGLLYLNTAKSLVYRGDFSIDDKMPGLVVGVDGKNYSAGGLGWTLVLVVPVWINKTIGGDVKNIELLAGFANPVLSLCLLVVLINLYTLVSKNKNVGWLLAMLTLFCTNLLILSKHSFAHLLSILTITSSFYFGLKYVLSKINKYLVWSGIFYGLFILSYNYSFAISSIGIFLFLLMGKIFDLKMFLKWLVWVLPFGLILCFYNYLRFGNILENGYSFLVDSKLTIKANAIDGLWGLLLSSGKSIWVYSPILVYSLYLAIKYFKRKWVNRLFLILLAVNVLFYSSLIFWSGELSYGPRYLSIIIPFGGLVLASHWREINKIVLTMLVFLGLWVQWVGVSIPYTRQYDWYDMEFMCVGSNGLTRKGELDYWNIGEFVPRFSPPYRLKRKVVEVWINYLNNKSGDLPDFWWVSKNNSSLLPLFNFLRIS
ncbi:MAG: hypothetical protein UU09_C0006G0004 [Microgenomates group bacterium GW2011_GWA2_40_6]|nr:MAG: hypothetical protein UU09_C0006G0004 [Microgenomates group bacterium GW2011_GWA2_40_6]